MKLYVPVVVCVRLFADCKGSQLRPIGDVTEVETHQAVVVEVWRCISANENTKGVLKECQ